MAFAGCGHTVRPAALKRVIRQFLQAADEKRVALLPPQRVKQPDLPRGLHDMLEEIDERVQRFQGRRLHELLLDPRNDLLLNLAQQRVHALIMQVKGAPIDIRPRAEVRDRDIRKRLFLSLIHI